MFQPNPTTARLLAVVLGIGMAAALSACATSRRAATVSPADSVRVLTGIPYATGHVLTPDGHKGTKVLTMDVYMPAQDSAAARPSLLLIHGGGFAEGDPGQMAELARFFVERGFVCFANSYRLRRDRPDATPEAALADTMAAVRWVRKHAPEYGGRADAIGAVGYSAGAFAAVAVAAADPGDYRVDGDIAPFNTPGESSALQAAVVVAGGMREDLKFDAADPPLLVIHGTRDQVVPVERGQAICDAAHAAGVTCEFIPIERADHWPLNADYQGRNVKEYAAAFLHRHLEAPRPAPVASADGVTGAPVPSPTGMPPAPDAPVVRLDASATKHGTVVMDPPGGRYGAGTMVKLIPVPDEGYRFAYWAGDIRDVRDPAYLVMDRDKRIEAGFLPREDAERVRIETLVKGAGTLRMHPPLARHVKGSTVTLEARPERGTRFTGWKGAALNGPTATLTADADQRVTAVFETAVAVRPEVVRLPAGGGVADVQVRGRDVETAVLWPVPGVDVEARGRSVRVAALPNPSAYPRTTFLRLTTPKLDGRYVQVPIVQEAGADAARLSWRGDPAQPDAGRILTANADDTFVLGAAQGTAIGFLTDGSGAPREIAAGQAYDVYAEWDLPPNPALFKDPDAPAELGASYCYVGIDSGSVNALQLRFGIEWKNIGNGEEWVLRGQYEAQQASALAQNNGQAPGHIRVRIMKRYDGADGAATVRAAYSLDGGPWQPYLFATPGHAEAYPLGARGEDRGTDYVTFKVRGLASTRFIAPVVEVPGPGGTGAR